MRSYFNLNRLTATALACIVGVAMLVGCSTTADSTLGYEIVPEHQKMVMRHLTFKGGKVISFDTTNSTDNESVYEERVAPSGNFFETSLYRTDSLLSANVSYGYFGIERSDTFGMRKAGFATSIVYMDSVSVTEGFGYKPIFDTMHILLTIEDFSGDTLTPIKYNVYELVKPLLGNVISSEDTTAYVNSDLSEMYDSSKPIFTFTFPDGESTGPATTSVAMTPVDMSATGATWDFIRRLMLIPEDYSSSSDWDGYANVGKEYYEEEEKFIEKFYGVYITPDYASMPEGSRGAMYNAKLSGSGLYLAGRTRNPKDPTMIQDTIGMSYYFNYLYIDGNMSVNKIEHDASTATIPFAEGKTLGEIAMDAHDNTGNKISRDNRTKLKKCYVEGMAGTLTELYFTDDFIDELKAIKEKDEEYSLVGVNQCLIYFYLNGADYDWSVTQGNAAMITPYLNASIDRLGMYTDFNTLTSIVDYDYVYEQTYSTTVNYDGNLNRSKACYMMNITGYMQLLLNYVSTLTKDGSGHYVFNKDDADYVTRTLYIGPEAVSPYTFKRSIINGMEGDDNISPIHIELTYTLFK